MFGSRYRAPDIWNGDEADGPYDAATRLMSALRDGGSAYEIAFTDEENDQGMPRLALEDRVSETARSAADEAMSHGKSGDHLRIAWSALSSRSPDPTKAYRETVRAVEVAAAPVVSQDDRQAELGKIVENLRDAPEGKFVVVLSGKHESKDTVNIVKLLTQLLHTQDHKRHGDPETISRSTSTMPKQRRRFTLRSCWSCWSSGSRRA